jgi:pyridoxamine 5'-phosphate oxidase
MSEENPNHLERIRREYDLGKLEESQLPEDPMVLFMAWLEEARAVSEDPTAMTLSTVERNGQPSSRIVLLKKVEQGRLIFFTNYHSRKSREIRGRTRVAAHFYWSRLERQVKIAGTARPIDDADSDLYFQSRPFESNITAWASPQSEVIPNRQYLEDEYQKYLKKYGNAEHIPRPAYWGGYAITPTRMEFWQGGVHRLHDRMEYTKKEERWYRVRLAP